MKRFFSNKKAKYVVTALVLIPLGLIGEYGGEMNLHQDKYLSYLSKAAKRRRKKKKNNKSNRLNHTKSAQKKGLYETGKWTPSFVSINQVQEKRSPFFQYNIGVGFLYFSDITANLGGAPSASFVQPGGPAPNFLDVPFKGRLQYNRTPLFEALIGYRIWPWFKIALSYQHQGDITVNTQAMESANTTFGKAIFQSQLCLDALMAKVYFELPWPMLIKNIATSPYLAAGIGPGWQSWTRVKVQYLDIFGTFRNRYLALNDKFSANAVWMLDLGLRFQDAFRKQHFSVVMGCKYNQWGQARNIGGIENQEQFKLGLAHPFRIKTVYSFAPYLGAQWNFPSSFTSRALMTVNGRDVNSWVPFWVQSKNFEDPGIWVQFNVGVGFLYFNGATGVVVADGAAPTPTVGRPTQFGPYRGGFSYNRTPLIEYLLGWRVLPWLRAGIGLQHQGQVTVQSMWQTSSGPLLGATVGHVNRLSSDLSLNSIMLRVFFDSPWAMIFKSVAFTPFIGAGIGPGWQSWKNITIQDSFVDPGLIRNNNPRFLKRKTSANAVWLIDAGCKLKSVLPDRDFSFMTGLKFNYWGQARNIGLLSQQGGNKQFLVKALSIKYVFSFAPYLGVQWNFPNTYCAKAPYTIDGKSPNVWIPFGTDSRNIQNKNSFWAQFNAGVGFLYFSDITATLTGIPGNSFNFEASGTPFQGKLSYNRSPLYEYLLGYRFNNWIKAAFSYLHQSEVCVQSEPQEAFLPTFNTNPLSKLTFRSNLKLDAILAKVIFELPYSLIFKSVASSPYLGFGLGVGWQNWEPQVQHLRFDTGFINYITDQPLKRKISANAVWILDAGVRLRSAYPNSNFSVLLGCKYNEWGQARNIGLITQQGSVTNGISHPFRIKTVYSFAPYLGVQWNF